jgi:hypothetical protein
LINKIKKTTMKKIKFINGIILLVSLSSCSDDESTSGPSIDFSADMLMGSNEVPTNTAWCYRNTKFNNTKVFTITVTHDLSSITGGHIHKGTAGTNGGVVFPFTALVPISYTSAALTAEQEADLMANLYYVNLHSSTFTGGEIRGQLVKGATTTTNTGSYTGEVINKTFILLNPPNLG